MLKRKAIQSKSLSLTFDDGPGNRLTPDILRILQEHNVKGTFFLLGGNISGREEIVKQIAKQRHEICSHSYDHLHQLKVSPVRAIRDIKLGWQAIGLMVPTTNLPAIRLYENIGYERIAESSEYEFYVKVLNYTLTPTEVSAP